MSDLVLNVRQVTSYPATTPVPPTAALLLQNGGLGSPYISATAQALVATALSSGTIPLGIGITPPANAAGGQTFTEDVVFQAGGAVLNNAYFNSAGQLSYLASGPASAFEWSPNLGFAMTLAPAGSAGQPVSGLTTMLSLGLAGNMVLPFGTLTVARDPASAMEVATMRWVGNNTVASFNGRIGQVQLWAQDIYTALCLDSAIATQNWVTSSINAAIQNMLMTCPFVNRWNGRTGSVYLTLSDITCVFFQPGQQPISPTPPLTSNDNSIATTQWVIEYVANEFAGGGGNLATQAWVLANTVNSFNGRQGIVTLTLADITNVGGAPINGPAFSGIPTAPTANPGQATGQIATTAFVQTAIANSVAGVASFNTRTGAVVLESADIVAAGGITNPSPNLTGAPTAPTAAPGTSTPQIANCQFVTNAISAGTVTSFNTRTGAVTLLLSDVTGVGGAPIANPTFTGVPAAPTANAGTSTTQIATTAFVSAAVAAAGGVSSFNSRTGAVDLEANDISAAGGLVNPSVGLTGVPTAPTATTGTNTSQIATTAFVVQALSSGAVSSFNTRTGAVVLSSTDITGAGGALIASPTFTGTPAAPTAAPGTNNTQLATTAFVTAAIAADTAGVTSFNTRTGAVTLTTADITGAGGAPTASPSFSGTPTAPTATLGTSTTQIATTAFVAAAIAGSGVNSFNGRTGAVTLIANDISAASGALIASPTFTGVPAAPTAAPGTATTQIASTAFVGAAITTAVPPASRQAPTVQRFVSGSGTYTPGAGVQYIRVRMVAGGGGGGGAIGGGAGGVGGNTTFGPWTCIGGGAGGPGVANGLSAVAGGGSGGTNGTTGTLVARISGGTGGAGFLPPGSQAVPGGGGGGSYFGMGQSGVLNNVFGAGGNGGWTNNAGSTGGSGGGGGEYAEFLLNAPAATAYAVGVAGGAGSGTTQGAPGGSGLIVVEEYY